MKFFVAPVQAGEVKYDDFFYTTAARFCNDWRGRGYLFQTNGFEYNAVNKMSTLF